MRPDIERRKRCPAQGRRASECTDTNTNEYRLIESGTQAQVVDLADFHFRRAVGRPYRLSEQPAITSIGTIADRAWQQFRTAIIERQRRPSAAIDLRIRHLREELVAALEHGGDR